MSLWGPAAEAEIEYRQAELKKSWGSSRASGSDRYDRAERRAQERTERRADRTKRQADRKVRLTRAEQIEEGIAGMRPAPAARHGLFA
ncbi:hypothetical protein AB1046_17280 [Promicromonospora sp. Populi]|uniref:hypothetical protein n=1 Tax=Promicromonospora sp. Populi TaxID=3239420 RepID=UPI0034E2EFF2